MSVIKKHRGILRYCLFSSGQSESVMLRVVPLKAEQMNDLSKNLLSLGWSYQEVTTNIIYQMERKSGGCFCTSGYTATFLTSECECTPWAVHYNPANQKLNGWTDKAAAQNPYTRLCQKEMRPTSKGLTMKNSSTFYIFLLWFK